MKRRRTLLNFYLTLGACLMLYCFALNDECTLKKTECVLRNLDDILCRLEAKNNSKIANDECQFNVTFKSGSNNVDFKDCIPFNDAYNAYKFSCHLFNVSSWLEEHHKLWVNTTFGDDTIVSEFVPKKNVVLTPPILHFKRNLTFDNGVPRVNISFETKFAQSDLRSKAAGCGEPLVNIVYKEIAPRIREKYTDEVSWNRWRNWDDDPWSVDSCLKKNVTQKNFIASENTEQELDCLGVNKSYFVQVRWKLNATKCKGNWSPFGWYKFTTNYLEIPYDDVNIEPGGSVELKCDSTKKISNFKWTVTNKKNGSAYTWTDFNPLYGHISKYTLRNVMATETVVECSSNETSGSDGTYVFAGYPPVPPKITCALRDYTDFYCRFNACHPIGNKDNEDSKVDFTTRFILRPESVKCKKHQISSSSCTSGCHVAKDLTYIPDITLQVTAKNRFGEVTSSFSSNPRYLIHPSPPRLTVEEIIPTEFGATAFVKASHKNEFHLGSMSENILRYCTIFLFQIRYVVVADDFIVGERKFLDEEQYWKDWWKGISHEDDEGKLFTNVNTRAFEKNNSDDSAAESPEPMEFKIESLSANTKYLLEVKWKFKDVDDVCKSVWSIPEYIQVTVGDISTPKFDQTGLVYFSGNTILPRNLSDLNWTKESSLLVWNHNSFTADVQRRNKVYYNVTTKNCKECPDLNFKGTNYLGMTMDHNRECSVGVEGSNSIDSTISEFFNMFHIDDETCSLKVTSVSLMAATNTTLRLYVEWVYVKQTKPHDCNVSRSMEESLQVQILTWRENCIKCFESVGGDRSDDIKGDQVHHFTLEITRSASKQARTNYVFQIGVLSLRNITPPVKLSIPLAPNTAYGFGVALSTKEKDLTLQSATMLTQELFYFTQGAQKSETKPTKLSFHDVRSAQLTISWQPSKPQDRSAPVLAYDIFYTMLEDCFPMHEVVYCSPPSGYRKECYENSIRYNVSDWSYNKWQYENRSFQNPFTKTLKNLDPDTRYTIGVREVFRSGESPCLRYISTRTKPVDMTWVAMLCSTFITILIIIAGLILGNCRGRVKKFFRREVPEPTIKIEWRHAISQTELSARPDDNINDYVALTKPLKDKSELLFFTDERDVDLIKEPPKESEQLLIQFEECNTLNNNLISKFNENEAAPINRSVSEFSDETLSLSKTQLPDASSLPPDEPCCSSSSTGLTSSSATCQNSGGDDDDSDSVYIAINEASDMSRLLGLEIERGTDPLP